MVTELLRAITYDVLYVARQEDFFSLSNVQRKQALQKHLGEQYPPLLQDYIASAKEATFEKDLSVILPLLAGGQSVLPESRALVTSKNLFFKTILSSLRDILSYKARTTALGDALHRIDGAGKLTKRTLERELQTLLLLATNQDSPIVQIATEAEIDTSSLQGIPSVSVQRSLLGGSRIFYNGTLTDHSWRARLTQVLKATIK